MKFVVGIDLGTTHCAVAASRADRPEVTLFQIEQLVAPGEVAAQELLPSFLYLAGPAELAANHTELPWGQATPIIGELAQRLGARVPGKLVASAKSWLVHGGLNRKAPILPWSAPDNAPHVSPYDASSMLLAHLRAAWDHSHPQSLLKDQDVVVTVPASFDGIARELTVQAAAKAGMGQVRLIEEPQAAFHDFLGTHEYDLAVQLGEAKLVLVVDVGGGTTDLTLVRLHLALEGSTEPPQIERIAVGGHLMLGGDNMDAALAHLGQRKAKISDLDPTEWAGLVQSARRAKEILLGDEPPDDTVVSIQRRGSRLIGGTKSVSLTREEVNRVLLDGFFPRTGPDEVATRQGRVGLTTLGLPYATDPAIPKHICDFLRRHHGAAQEAGAAIVDGLPKPDLLLLNGGVFNAPALAQRLSEVLAGWYGEPVQLLNHTCLDTAVARGATRTGLVRRGFGRAITGGAARAYYIGVEGPDGTSRGTCIAPRGMKEGTTVDSRDRIYELMVNRPVSFPLFCTTRDHADSVGQIAVLDDDFDALPPLRTVLRSKGDDWEKGIPVWLSTKLNESGTLELYLVTLELPPRRWRLEFALRAEEAPERSSSPAADLQESVAKLFPEARRMSERAFGKYPGELKSLRRSIEKSLGPRSQWSSVTCRAIVDLFIELAPQRKCSSNHELNWMRLVGWGMRPGFGFGGDEKRLRQLWVLQREGLIHFGQKTNWGDWWVLWRRVAGGLDREQQESLFEEVMPWLSPKLPQGGPRMFGQVEMVRLLAALERLSAEQKEQAGNLAFGRIKKTGVWPIGRLGARQSFRGHTKDVVSAAVASQWLERVLDLDWDKQQDAAFASVLMARMTDSERDIDAGLRKMVLKRLKKAGVPPRWMLMVSEPTALSDKDTKQVLGDALPTGLRLT
ncbi:MAG: Hsp70 family protein [Proteobacteria bacterium]|nr:Hsp70 family protein [Pseudomonadota bacterium]